MPPVPNLLPARQWIVDYAQDLLQSERLYHRILGAFISIIPLFNDALVDMFELEDRGNRIILHLVVFGAVASVLNTGGLSSGLTQWFLLLYLTICLPVYVQTGHLSWRTAGQIWLVMFCVILHTTRILFTS